MGEKYADRIPSSNLDIAKYIEKITPCNKNMFLSPTDRIEILRLIEQLPCKNSSGFKDVSNKLLKELKTEIIRPLADIFNISMVTGEFPVIMKNAEKQSHCTRVNQKN